MQITLIGHDYRYAAEQMLLTLFPGEKPGTGGNTLTLSLSKGPVWLTARAVLVYEGKRYVKSRRARTSALTGGLQDDRVCQRILKLAFYDAGVPALGREPPWGAITGVRPVKIPTKAMEWGASPARAERELRDVYRVSPIRRRLAMDCAGAALAAKRSLKPGEVSLYVGIPFCPSRCVYCSFVSADVKGCLPLVEPFLDGLCRETAALGAVLRKTGCSVRTVYIGGGTPTTLSPEQLERLLSVMEAELPLGSCTEFTVEAGRPDTISRAKLAVLSAHPLVDRVSVNPQSLEAAALDAIGRPHTPGDIQNAYALVRQAGTLSVNMDLIAGLPADSVEGFTRSLGGVLALEPENVTVHTLALKKGSRLMEEGGALPGAADVEAMLDRAWDTLRGKGYAPYYLYRQKYMSGSFENVGWARPGYVSLYNIAMMEELHTILALGGGGVTKLVWPETGKIERVANPKYPQEYLRDVDKICGEKEALAPFLLSLKGSV